MKAKKQIFLNSVFLVIVCISLVLIYFYWELNSRLKEIIKSQATFQRVSEITPEELNLYKVYLGNNLDSEVLLLIPSKSQSMILHHTKDWLRYQILRSLFSEESKIELGINLAYMGEGNGRPIVGYFHASQFYFCKPLSELDYLESTQLFAIRRAPQAALNQKDLLKKWRDANIERLSEAGQIDSGKNVMLKQGELRKFCNQ